jgi:hypothetical protein
MVEMFVVDARRAADGDGSPFTLSDREGSARVLPEEISRVRNIVGMVAYLLGLDWTIGLDSLLQTLGDHWRQPADPADVLCLSDFYYLKKSLLTGKLAPVIRVGY